MDKHIAKETELNAYSQVDRLDDATLTFAFGQLSQAQEQIKVATREFIRECATEIRTETDSRNARLVEKIIDKHNRLIEVMLKKSTFLKKVIGEITVQMSSGNRLTKEQVKSITDALKTTIDEILKGKSESESKSETKVKSKGKSKAEAMKVDPLALLKDQTVVQQIAKCFKTRIHSEYKKALTKDASIAKKFIIRKNLTGMRSIAKSVLTMNNMLNQQVKNQQALVQRLRASAATRTNRTSGRMTKAVKSAQIEKLKLYNDFVYDRTLKVIDRVEKAFSHALWAKVKASLSKAVGNFKSMVVSGVKSLFSVKTLKGGIGIVGKVLSTVLIKPFVAVGKLLKVSLKGVYDFGVGIVKSAGKITGKIFKFLKKGSVLKKIFAFLLTPAGAFVAGYLFAFIKSKIKVVFEGISEKVSGIFIRIGKIIGGIKMFVAKGLLKIVDGISTNKVLIAFLTKDSATIAEFVDNLQIQFDEKFSVIKDFFEEITANMTGNVMATGLGWIGSIIGTAICPGLGTVIGSLAGALLGTLIGKLFASKLYELPDNNVNAVKRMSPFRAKYKTFHKNESYKGKGVDTEIQRKISQLKRMKSERKLQYDLGNSKTYDTGDIDAEIGKLENLQTSIRSVSNDEDYTEFYTKVELLIEAASKTSERGLFDGSPVMEQAFNALPNSGKELMDVLNSGDPVEKNKFIGNYVDGKTVDISPGRSQLFKDVKKTILNQLYFMASGVNMKPEIFCKTYDKMLSNALNTPYVEPNSSNLSNRELTGHNTLRDYLTRPVFDDRGNGVYQWKSGLTKQQKALYTQQDRENYALQKEEDIEKFFAGQITTSLGAGRDQVSSRVNHMVALYLDKILMDICGGDRDQLDMLKNNFPVETWFRFYATENIFDYFHIAADGNFEPIKGTDISHFLDGYKDLVKQIINLPNIGNIIKAPEDRKQDLLDMLNKLRQRLNGAMDVQDQSFQEEMAKMEENEAKMKSEIESDPEYIALQKQLDEVKRRYDEILKIEAQKQAELTEAAKGVQPVVVGPTRKAAAKQESLSEQEKPKPDPMKLNSSDFGYSMSGGSFF